MTSTTRSTFDLRGDLTVHRLGYGAMQLPGSPDSNPRAVRRSGR